MIFSLNESRKSAVCMRSGQALFQFRKNTSFQSSNANELFAYSKINSFKRVLIYRLVLKYQRKNILDSSPEKNFFLDCENTSNMHFEYKNIFFDRKCFQKFFKNVFEIFLDIFKTSHYFSIFHHQFDFENSFLINL